MNADSSLTQTLIQLSNTLGVSVEEFYQQLILILSGLVAVGLLSMAFVEIVKLIPFIRRNFFRYYILIHIHQTISTKREQILKNDIDYENEIGKKEEKLASLKEEYKDKAVEKQDAEHSFQSDGSDSGKETLDSAIKKELEARYYVEAKLLEISELQRLSAMNPEEWAVEAENFVATISTSGEIKLLYSQSIDKVISEWKSVANIALSWPWSRLSSTQVEDKDAQDKYTYSEPSDSLWFIYALSRNISPRDWDTYKKNVLQNKQDEELDSHIASLVDSSLHGMQLLLARRWKRAQQLLAIAISMILILNFGGDSYQWIVFAFVGGLMAPFCHDIVSILSKVKK